MDSVEFVQTVVKELQGIVSVPVLQTWAGRLQEAALLGRPRMALKKFVEANPRLVVSIKSDEQAQFGLVSDVLEELRRAEALRVNFATDREQTE